MSLRNLNGTLFPRPVFHPPFTALPGQDHNLDDRIKRPPLSVGRGVPVGPTKLNDALVVGILRSDNEKRTELGSLLDLAVDPPLLLRLRSMIPFGRARGHGTGKMVAQPVQMGRKLKGRTWLAGPTNAVAGRFGAPFPVGLKSVWECWTGLRKEDYWQPEWQNFARLRVERIFFFFGKKNKMGEGVRGEVIKMFPRPVWLNS